MSVLATDLTERSKANISIYQLVLPAISVIVLVLPAISVIVLVLPAMQQCYYSATSL